MSALTFSWRRQRSSWLLAGFIFAALLFHSATFFLFQTIVPPRIATPRTAPPVQLLTPFAPDGTPSPENEAVLNWIATADPAIVARVPDVQPSGLLNIPYRPSYLTPRTAPLGVPPEPASIQFPPARDPLSLIIAAPQPPAAPSVIAHNTLVTFSASLATRAPASTKFTPTQRSNKPIENTRLLLGVSDKGEVRFSFLQQASGFPALDAEVDNFLRTLKFSPSSDAPITWGIVTFEWGDDATTQ
jgi:hypothetical protein